MSTFSDTTTSSGSSDDEQDEVWFECKICKARVTPQEKDAHRLLHKKELEKLKKKTVKKRQSPRLNDSIFSPVGSAITVFDPVKKGANKRGEDKEPASAPPTKKRSYKRFDTAVTKHRNDGG